MNEITDGACVGAQYTTFLSFPFSAAVHLSTQRVGVEISRSRLLIVDASSLKSISVCTFPRNMRHF